MVEIREGESVYFYIGKFSWDMFDEEIFWMVYLRCESIVYGGVVVEMPDPFGMVSRMARLYLKSMVKMSNCPEEIKCRESVRQLLEI